MKRYTQQIERLHAQRQLAGLGLHFARFLLNQASQPSAELALAAALVCQANMEGHVCLDLRSLTEPSGTAQGEGVSPTVSGLARLREVLLRSGVVGRPGDFQPLILDGAERLYLHRYWDYEQRLAESLSRRARQRDERVDKAQLAAAIDGLFPATSGDSVDWQKVAAAAAVLRRLSIISGGPGTGKTTTVTRILALLRQLPGGADLRIALAAPTGKAAWTHRGHRAAERNRIRPKHAEAPNGEKPRPH